MRNYAEAFLCLGYRSYMDATHVGKYLALPATQVVVLLGEESGIQKPGLPQIHLCGLNG